MLEKSIFSLIMTFWDMTKLPFRKLDLYSVIWVGYVIVKDFCQVGISFSLACYIKLKSNHSWKSTFIF